MERCSNSMPAQKAPPKKDIPRFPTTSVWAHGSSLSEQTQINRPCVPSHREEIRSCVHRVPHRVHFSIYNHLFASPASPTFSARRSFQLTHANRRDGHLTDDTRHSGHFSWSTFGRKQFLSEGLEHMSFRKKFRVLRERLNFLSSWRGVRSSSRNP